MKMPPSNIEAEKSVLGAIFLSPNKTFTTVKKYISASDFYLPANAELFAAFEKCIVDGIAPRGDNPLELAAIKDILEKRGIFNKGDWLKYIMELVDSVSYLGSEEENAKLIRDRSQRRKIINVCNEVIGICNDIAQDPAVATDKMLSGVTETRPTAEATDFGTALVDYAELLKKRQGEGAKLPGISTGFPHLDAFLGGLEPAKLYIIGGRPAMGKTAFAFNVMTSIAQNGGTVMLFSLEMNRNEVMKRIVSSVAEIDNYKLKMARFTETEFSRIANIFHKINENGIYICDDNYQTADSIYSKCLEVNAELSQKRRRINAIVIDYLQLISAADKKTDRRNVVGDISRACKIMAKKLNCPVILVSQLSRASEARPNKRPQLSDLRESGDIEQDADAVMFLYRDEYYNANEHNKGKAELIVAKNRDGEVGKINLRWVPEFVSFKGATK